LPRPDDGLLEPNGRAKAEQSVPAELLAKIKPIVTETGRSGYGPAKLNLDALSIGDQGFGLLVEIPACVT
jgi:hypothetical protein